MLPNEVHSELKNTPTDPLFGHVIERSWSIIFNCTDVALAKTCATGYNGMCQCYD
jgi:hypothetical protein